VRAAPADHVLHLATVVAYPPGRVAVPAEPDPVRLEVSRLEQGLDGALRPGCLRRGLRELSLRLLPRLGHPRVRLGLGVRPNLLGVAPQGSGLAVGGLPGVLGLGISLAADPLRLGGRLRQQLAGPGLRLRRTSFDEVRGVRLLLLGDRPGGGGQGVGLAARLSEHGAGRVAGLLDGLVGRCDPLGVLTLGVVEDLRAVRLGGPDQDGRLVPGVADQLLRLLRRLVQLLAGPPEDAGGLVPLGGCLVVGPLRLGTQPLGVRGGLPCGLLGLLTELVGHLLGAQQHTGGGTVCGLAVHWGAVLVALVRPVADRGLCPLAGPVDIVVSRALDIAQLRLVHD
jgi:hypothetical protein